MPVKELTTQLLNNVADDIIDLTYDVTTDTYVMLHSEEDKLSVYDPDRKRKRPTRAIAIQPECTGVTCDSQGQILGMSE